ncbi:MAG: ABC transporter permease [Alicyclobacillus sp.]|nr:ABC transporter permease [Alicyclobacillus sp.]
MASAQQSTSAEVQSLPMKASGRVIKSPTRLAMERFMHNRAAVGGIVMLILIILFSLSAPLLTHWNPSLQDLMNTDAPPSPQHILGTNSNGIDYFALDAYGGRIDLLIGFGDMIVIMFISIVLGGLAGYYGKWVDSLIMRAVDFMLNFPFLLLIIVLSSVINTSSTILLMAVIAFTGWAPVTRFVRGLFLNLRESEFVLASKMAGAGAWRIIFKHMLPNAMGPLVVNATFLVASLIGLEAALAIIGFGVPVTTPTWGNVLNGAQDYFTLKTEPWAWMPPAGLIFLTILSINFVGDGLRDAFDPSFEK